MEPLHRIQWPGDYERADQSNAFKSNLKHTIKGYYTFPFPHPQNTSSAEDVSAGCFCCFFVSLALPIYNVYFRIMQNHVFHLCLLIKTRTTTEIQIIHTYAPVAPVSFHNITALFPPHWLAVGICFNLLSPLAQWGRIECGKCKCTVVELSWVKCQAQLHCHMLCEFAASVHMALCG